MFEGERLSYIVPGYTGYSFVLPQPHPQEAARPGRIPGQKVGLLADPRVCRLRALDQGVEPIRVDFRKNHARRQ